MCIKPIPLQEQWSNALVETRSKLEEEKEEVTKALDEVNNSFHQYKVINWRREYDNNNNNYNNYQNIKVYITMFNNDYNNVHFNLLD